MIKCEPWGKQDSTIETLNNSSLGINHKNMFIEIKKLEGRESYRGGKNL